MFSLPHGCSKIAEAATRLVVPQTQSQTGPGQPSGDTRPCGTCLAVPRRSDFYVYKLVMLSSTRSHRDYCTTRFKLTTAQQDISCTQSCSPSSVSSCCSCSCCRRPPGDACFSSCCTSWCAASSCWLRLLNCSAPTASGSGHSSAISSVTSKTARAAPPTSSKSCKQETREIHLLKQSSEVKVSETLAHVPVEPWSRQVLWATSHPCVLKVLQKDGLIVRPRRPYHSSYPHPLIIGSSHAPYRIMAS